MDKIRVSSVMASSDSYSCDAKIGDRVLVNVQGSYYEWGLIKGIESRDAAIVAFDDGVTPYEREFPASAITLVKGE